MALIEDGPPDIHPPEEFVKHDQGKPRLDLLPPVAIELVGEVLAHGAEKYDADNWRKVDDRRRYLGAALRHLMAYARGEDIDPDSGLSHLAHASASTLFLLEAQELNLGDDTRPKASQ